MFESRTADLGGISSGPLEVSDIFQKAFIEVNEEGSEASAVTGKSLDKSISLSIFITRQLFLFVFTCSEFV